MLELDNAYLPIPYFDFPFVFNDCIHHLYYICIGS